MSDYADIDDVFPDPAGLIWMKGIAADQALRDIGADPCGEVVNADWSRVQATLWDSCEEDENDENEDDETSGRAALFAVEGDGAVLIEPMSCWGADTALLRRLTASGGEALGLSWTVNLHVSVTFAARGEILATFDPMELFAATGDERTPLPAGWTPCRSALPNGTATAKRPPLSWASACPASASIVRGLRAATEW
ncbi:DUF6461 domain-containing protein [Nonomuraea sp. G32]|nr:DUF6461 domain-containing protein [Nonomuraea sp. G32]